MKQNLTLISLGFRCWKEKETLAMSDKKYQIRVNDSLKYSTFCTTINDLYINITQFRINLSEFKDIIYSVNITATKKSVDWVKLEIYNIPEKDFQTKQQINSYITKILLMYKLYYTSV